MDRINDYNEHYSWFSKLPTESSSRTERSMITPCATFTPFKRCPEDEMFGSSDVTAPDSEVPVVSKRPNALAGIVETKTPVIKSKHIPAPAKVLTSDDFRLKGNLKGMLNHTFTHSQQIFTIFSPSCKCKMLCL